ncbi:unnamed protein product [Arctogadus glacialis]
MDTWQQASSMFVQPPADCGQRGLCDGRVSLERLIRLGLIPAYQTTWRREREGEAGWSYRVMSVCHVAVGAESRPSPTC